LICIFFLFFGMLCQEKSGSSDWKWKTGSEIEIESVTISDSCPPSRIADDDVVSASQAHWIRKNEFPRKLKL
jgi:hypothetical protein